MNVTLRYEFSSENESVGLDYSEVLDLLSPEQLRQLTELKQSEMDMFGYTFNQDERTFGITTGT